MKRIQRIQLLLLFLLFCVYTHIHAQCPPGTLSLQNQASVATFATNYPDCTEINGTLFVGGSVENIDALDGIQKVLGDLIFTGNNTLMDISGLNQLDTITGNFFINNNNSVTAISGFSSLDWIGGTTIISNNSDLESISGFGNLETVGTFQILTNAALQSISGLAQLDMAASLEIKNHPVLSDISGLESLTMVTNNFLLDDNGGLNQISLNNLINVGERLSISLNDNLLTISGLQSLTQVGKLFISANNTLTTIDGFDQLESIDGGLDMLGNVVLTDISALDHPLTIGGSIFLISNTLLAECSIEAICGHITTGGMISVQNNFVGCNTVEEVEANCTTICPPGDVVMNTQADVANYAATYPDCTEILGNLNIGPISGGTSDITDISGLSSLTEVQGNLGITNNLDLVSISGLNEMAIVGGDLLIINNNSLTNTAALESFILAGGGITLQDNPQLTGLTGFGQIASISLDLRIVNNDALQNLNDFSVLQGLNNLELSDNALLNDISLFENMIALGNEVIIRDNPQLSMCSVHTICDHLLVGGNAIINNNAPNCNSIEQVTTICTVAVENAFSADDIVVYPNPSNGIFTISGLPQNSNEISIFDALGKMIYVDKTANNIVDISAFPTGIYYLAIKIEGNYAYKKLLVE